MKFDLYYIFFQVAMCSNITKASEQLHISQPAVSKHIKHLEDMIGEPLFVRSQKGVVLTKTGEVLFLKTKKALLALEEAEQELESFQKLEKGHIHFGISKILARTFLFPYLKDFHEKYPNVIIEISTDPTEVLMESLKNGKLDFIIAKEPQHLDKDVSFINLLVTNDIFVSNKKQSLTDADAFIVQTKPSHSRKQMDLFFHKESYKNKSLIEVASASLVIEFIKAGFGIGLVTELYIQKELDEKKLFKVKEIASLNIGVIHLTQHLSLASKTLIDMMTQ